MTTVSDAWNALSASRTHVDELGAPVRAGVYAIFLAPTASLPGVEPPETGLLYVGKSRNLAQRDIDTHFATGQSGFSTVRRRRFKNSMRCRAKYARSSSEPTGGETVNTVRVQPRQDLTERIEHGRSREQDALPERIRPVT